MTSQSPNAQYVQPNVDMNSFLVATCRQDQNGQYPPVYDVPHGTIQLAQQFNVPRGNWPFPNSHPGVLAQSDSEPVSPTFPPTGNYQQYQGQYTGPATPSQPRQEEKSADAGKRVPVKESDGEEEDTKTPKRRSMAKGEKDSKTGRRKIKIEFIDDDSRRHITFSKRKAGIMKKAYELATLTGTQVLLLVVSQTGLVYTFTTPKLEAVVKQPEGRNLIQECLNAPDPVDGQSHQNMGSSSAGADDDGPEDDDNVEAEDDEDDDYLADGIQTQAFGPFGNEGGPFAQNPQLFHPGSVTPQTERPSQVKRRRTNANLAAAAGRGASKEQMAHAAPAQDEQLFMMPQNLDIQNGLGGHMVPGMPNSAMPFYDGNDPHFMYGTLGSKGRPSM